ncbi:hypothetical protein CEQ21_23775 [Niallia circulans]|uniref:Uncharacterized protein n=1 Tax=Niallia circulans TaxID=1397 RepID=A0A553SN43_NIACI|nr:hypothetical protein [Niallia circulans]TRZ38413.1 hypothetical protein CEQ21_23775 [Niallia circulans]
MVKAEKCEGLACKVRGADKLFPFSAWDSPDKVNWFCSDHLSAAKAFSEKEKQAFLHYYADPEKRKWLPHTSLMLYEKYSEKF